MPSSAQSQMDAADIEILRLLQEDGRITTAEVARAIHMSPAATAERVRRLVDEGVIRGYRAIVDPAAIGYPLTAFVRLRRTGSGERFQEFLDRTPEIREAHHITGEDCYLMRVMSRSMEDLKALVDELTTFGFVTTNLVFTTRAQERPLLPAE